MGSFLGRQLHLIQRCCCQPAGISSVPLSERFRALPTNQRLRGGISPSPKLMCQALCCLEAGHHARRMGRRNFGPCIDIPGIQGIASEVRKGYCARSHHARRVSPGKFGKCSAVPFIEAVSWKISIEPGVCSHHTCRVVAGKLRPRSAVPLIETESLQSQHTDSSPQPPCLPDGSR